MADKKIEECNIIPNALQTIQGPNQKWLIDVLGNIFLSGRLQVEGWIDPAFLQLDNQTSSTGIPNNSVYTLNNTLTFKNSSGTVKTVEADRAGARCAATSSDTDTTITATSSSTANTLLTLDIAPNSTSNRILVIGGYQGTNSSGAIGTPGILLDRTSPTATVAHITVDTEGGSTGTRTFGGVIVGIDAPATTSTRTYRLRVYENISGTWTIAGSSLSVIEVTLT